MNILDCYQLLGLTTQANLTEVKATYRRLARQYHPDTNPGNRQAQEKFIQITEAYKAVLRVVGVTNPPEIASPGPPQPQSQPTPPPPPPTVTPHHPPKAKPRHTAQGKATATPQPSAQPLSPFDQQLKTISYQQLRELLKYQRFPRAVALVEGLSQRLPQDPEVRQWQAITYQRWGRHLIGENQLDKARVYLQKALRTDPHNKSLWAEVEQDFRRLEKVF